HRYRQQRKKVARLHEKVAHARQDYLHKLSTKLVRDRLTQVATARWGTTSARAKHRQTWVQAQFATMKKGRWQQVVKKLQRWSDCAVAQDCIRYFVNQQDRMNYPYYRRRGWCCSSAVIESACKQIRGGRIKGSGRRWNVAGANAMITLRCAFANGEENVLYEKRRQDNILKLKQLMKVPRKDPALPLAA
ncbi:MAG: transposase, partial [Gammaproteobacteria bacterium]|nr:transposase [Gammaproteobacteria bacterium]MYF02904.1 transposase [Gammaproteobacteria bacterium]